MPHLTLHHGSSGIVEAPTLAQGNPRNDYGRGFYCTPDLELAKEWACNRKRDGYANEYELDETGLETLDLLDGSFTVLHWIALLLANRHFTLYGEYAAAVRELLLERYLVDLRPYDVVMGYRADSVSLTVVATQQVRGMFLQNARMTRRVATTVNDTAGQELTNSISSLRECTSSLR